MDRSKSIVLLGLCVFALSGCLAMHSCDDANEVRLFRTQTEYMLNVGIKNYEDGDFAASINVLQGLIEQKRVTKGEKTLAYKYLAFNYCVSPDLPKEQGEKMCRDAFKKALDLKPDFNLSPAEAGHPVWGPIFSRVKNKLVK